MPSGKRTNSHSIETLAHSQRTFEPTLSEIPRPIADRWVSTALKYPRQKQQSNSGYSVVCQLQQLDLWLGPTHHHFQNHSHFQYQLHRLWENPHYRQSFLLPEVARILSGSDKPELATIAVCSCFHKFHISQNHCLYWMCWNPTRYTQQMYCRKINSENPLKVRRISVRDRQASKL